MVKIEYLHTHTHAVLRSSSNSTLSPYVPGCAQHSCFLVLFLQFSLDFHIPCSENKAFNHYTVMQCLVLQPRKLVYISNQLVLTHTSCRNKFFSSQLHTIWQSKDLQYNTHLVQHMGSLSKWTFLFNRNASPGKYSKLPILLCPLLQGKMT